MNEKYSQLAQALTQAVQELANTNTTQTEELVTRRLTSISEDIHWLLLVAGFSLFEINAESDQSRVPGEIMAYSIRCSQFVNVELVTDLITRLGQLDPSTPTPTQQRSPPVPLLNMVSTRLVEACPGANDPVDPVTSLFFSSFRLSELEIYAKSRMSVNTTRPMFEYLSPQVSETLMWFMRESVRAYVFMTEKNYDELSSILHLVFAPDTPLAALVLNFLLRKILINFHIWSAENTITSQSAKLLLGKNTIFTITKFIFTFQNFVNNVILNLPKSNLIKRFKCIKLTIKNYLKFLIKSRIKALHFINFGYYSVIHLK